MRRRGRTPARDPARPLSGRRPLELLRVGVRPRASAIPDACVVHEPDSSSPARLRTLVEAGVRPRACLLGCGRPRARTDRRRAARCDDAWADRLPANPDRRARKAVHDLQVSNDARRRGTCGRRGLGQCRRSTRDAHRVGAAADASGRAAAIAERSSRRHVHRRAAPRAPRVHRVARSGRSLLGQASARQAGYHRLGASPLGLCRRLRQHGRQAVLRSLVPAPPEPGHRPCGVRQDVLRRPRAGAAPATDRAGQRPAGRTREAADTCHAERRRCSRALPHRAGSEPIGQADARHPGGVGACHGATTGAAATRHAATATDRISRAGWGGAGLDLGRASSGTRPTRGAADRPCARHIPQPATRS